MPIPKASAVRSKDVSVLVVDDNKHMVAIICAMLLSFGFRRIFSANEPLEGLEMVRQGMIDLVIVDYRMPVVDGIEFVRQVRTATNSPNRFLPIIMLTAHSDVSCICEARDIGVTEFLCKPLSAKEFYRKIEVVVEHPRRYIKSEGYFGPDRRRRQDPDYNGMERRRNPATMFIEEIVA